MDVLSVVDMIGSLDRCHHVTIRARKRRAHQHRIIEVKFLLKQAYVNMTFHMSRVSLEIISCNTPLSFFKDYEQKIKQSNTIYSSQT